MAQRMLNATSDQTHAVSEADEWCKSVAETAAMATSEDMVQKKRAELLSEWRN